MSVEDFASFEPATESPARASANLASEALEHAATALASSSDRAGANEELSRLGFSTLDISQSQSAEHLESKVSAVSDPLDDPEVRRQVDRAAEAMRNSNGQLEGEKKEAVRTVLADALRFGGTTRLDHTLSAINQRLQGSGMSLGLLPITRGNDTSYYAIPERDGRPVGGRGQGIFLGKKIVD